MRCDAASRLGSLLAIEQLAEKAKKFAEKSHREKIMELNAKLDSLSEHFDIPKVGPG